METFSYLFKRRYHVNLKRTRSAKLASLSGSSSSGAGIGFCVGVAGAGRALGGGGVVLAVGDGHGVRVCVGDGHGVWVCVGVLVGTGVAVAGGVCVAVGVAVGGASRTGRDAGVAVGRKVEVGGMVGTVGEDVGVLITRCWPAIAGNAVPVGGTGVGIACVCLGVRKV
jgi:hypothetical protein